MNVILSAILLGISLCADCFAVALCSSVTVTREEVRRKVWTIAAVFAVIQTGLFMAGWGLGFIDGVRSKSEHLNLSGFKSIVLGGVATSIDAAVVGLSMAMDAAPWSEIWPISVSIFVFTALSVLVGMLSGSFIGRKLGYSARIVGGLVLIGLGVNILL